MYQSVQQNDLTETKFLGLPVGRRVGPVLGNSLDDNS